MWMKGPSLTMPRGREKVTIFLITPRGGQGAHPVLEGAAARDTH